MTDIGVPFQVEIEPKEIDDLRERLLRTRWLEAATVDDWSQGVPSTTPARSSPTGSTATT